MTVNSQSGGSETNSSAQLTLSFFISSETPAHAMVLPTLRLGLPSSVNNLETMTEYY